MAGPISVVGQKYCISNYPVELRIARKSLTFNDVNDNGIFKVEVLCSLHHRRILRDSTGNPIITLSQKKRTMHSRWQVFSGDSHDKKDLLFTTVTTSCLQMRTKLNVFLANNEKEKDSDFRLKGSFKGSCIIYTGHDDSKIILAQMKKSSKDKFNVTINQNIDYAFIAALFVILDKVDHICKEWVKDVAIEGTSQVVQGVVENVVSNL